MNNELIQVKLSTVLFSYSANYMNVSTMASSSVREELKKFKTTRYFPVLHPPELMTPIGNQRSRCQHTLNQQRQTFLPSPTFWFQFPESSILLVDVFHIE